MEHWDLPLCVGHGVGGEALDGTGQVPSQTDPWLQGWTWGWAQRDHRAWEGKSSSSSLRREGLDLALIK